MPVLHQDPDLVAVAKPVGLNTHSDAGDQGSGADVVSVVRRQLGLDYLGVHHRLDREVSGVLVFAARRQANAALARAFEGRTVQKQYLALVRGRLPQPSGSIDAPLRPAHDGEWRVAAPGDRSARAALTLYQVEREGPDAAYSVVRLDLQTGRTHQLRLHLAHVGCPIVGDPLYGQRDPFPRLMLHAVSLQLPHPASGTALSLQAPPPELLQRALAGDPLPELQLASRLQSAGRLEVTSADSDALHGLLALARERREPLAADPATASTVFRLVNGAGDGLPGLSLDRFGSLLLLEVEPPRLLRDAASARPLLQAVRRLWPGLTLWARARGVPPHVLHGAGSGDEVRATELTLCEDGLKLRLTVADALEGLISPALREVRSRLAASDGGWTLLSCFSGAGAFGLAALAAGAARAVFLEPDGSVLQRVRQAHALNGLPTPAPADLIAGDVSESLVRLARRHSTFDVVVLDLTGEPRRHAARRIGQSPLDDWIRLAAPTVEADGVLLVCCDDPKLGRREFRARVLEALRAAGRPGDVVALYHEPELDFPSTTTAQPPLKVLAVEVHAGNRYD